MFEFPMNKKGSLVGRLANLPKRVGGSVLRNLVKTPAAESFDQNVIAYEALASTVEDFINRYSMGTLTPSFHFNGIGQDVVVLKPFDGVSRIGVIVFGKNNYERPIENVDGQLMPVNYAVSIELLNKTHGSNVTYKIVGYDGFAECFVEQSIHNSAHARTSSLPERTQRPNAIRVAANERAKQRDRGAELGGVLALKIEYYLKLYMQRG